MRLGAASVLLCAALWHGVALAAAADPATAADAAAVADTANTEDAADTAAGQDPDLDLIPKASKPPGCPQFGLYTSAVTVCSDVQCLTVYSASNWQGVTVM